MTEEEAKDMFYYMYQGFKITTCEVENDRVRFGVVGGKDTCFTHILIFFNRIYSLEQFEWLNEHHFDYRGLIERGLALAAPEGMYERDEYDYAQVEKPEAH